MLCPHGEGDRALKSDVGDGAETTAWSLGDSGSRASLLFPVRAVGGQVLAHWKGMYSQMF